MKRRHKNIILNIFAFSALAFAIYLSFFHKEKDPEPTASRAASTQPIYR